MDKSKIKSFAILARRSLIKSVTEKAYRIGIYEDEIKKATPIQSKGKEIKMNLLAKI